MVFLDKAPNGFVQGAFAGIIALTLNELIRSGVRHQRLMRPMRKEYNELLRREKVDAGKPYEWRLEPEGEGLPQWL